MWWRETPALRRAAGQATVRGAVGLARDAYRVAGRWRIVLEWRTCTGHEAAVRRLETLRVALAPLGWRSVGLYDREEFRFPVPLLWVHDGGGPAGGVGAVVTVRATPGGTWAYFEAGDGRSGFVSSCGDAKAAAEAVDLLLRQRMFPRRQWARS